MALSLEQLDAFVAAAETGSFSAAARRLRRAQSAVSTQVANLEIDLGLALFDRGARYPVLTAAGERLLPEARVLLERREHLVGVARGLEAGTEARLVLAMDELYPEHMIGGLMAEFAAAFPDVEMELLFPLMEDVSRLVLAGTADLGIMWRQEQLPPLLDFQTLGWVPLKLVCGRDHPLARQVVTWEELKRHRQLMVATQTDSEEKKRLRIAAEVWWVESHWVILELVKHGVGWSLVSDHVLAGSSTRPDLVVPELGFDSGDWPVGLELVWHKQRPRGPAATWLKNRIARERIGPMGTG